jgi:hypothetical protein
MGGGIIDLGVGDLLRLAARCILQLALCSWPNVLWAHFSGPIKKPPWEGRLKAWDQGLKDLSLGVLHSGELGLAQPFGLADLLADQG